jgi:hypothetical protein
LTDLPPGVTETHCATVFFRGNRAYKIKKALDLGFVDFSSVTARGEACTREVELNRRFAPDVYLGVAEVRPDGPGSQEACDWMVVMRRMPDERRLSALIQKGKDVGEAVRDVARQLAVHHAAAQRSIRIDHQGTPAALRTRWMDNLKALQAFSGAPVEADALAEIGRRALRFVDGRHALLDSRVLGGKIRDGHGDLLSDDIFCLDDGARVLDCLEFDDDLRSVDGLDDAACLAMDLERVGAPELGNRFLDWFCEFSGEARVESLLHHYVAYRAVVRLKVACLRHAQGDADAAVQAGVLAGIALCHLRRAEPRVILVGGGPGTGKSTVASALADRLGAVLIRSDRLRKVRAGLSPATSAESSWRTGLYTEEITADTYQDLIDQARVLLAYGETVVLDATWSHAAFRSQMRSVLGADRAETLVELWCRAPRQLVDARLQRREDRRAHDPGDTDPSDATTMIARRMEQTFDAWPEASVVGTSGELVYSVAEAYAATGNR